MAKQYGTRVDSPIVAGSDDRDDIASAIGSQLQGGFQRFASMSERDAWTASFSTRLKGTTCLVQANDDGDPQWFEWKSDTSDWEDMEIQPKDNGNLHTFPVTAHDASSNTPYATGIDIGPTLETHTNEDSGHAYLGVRPDAYEERHGEAWLGYFNYSSEIRPASHTSDSKSALWPMAVAWGGSGMYLDPRPSQRAMGLQEADQKDPNVTGGTDWLIGCHFSFDGTAPEDGYIRIVYRDANTEDILIDEEGHWLGATVHYKKGDKLQPLTFLDVVKAKGLTYYQCCVTHSFHSETLKLSDYTRGGSCLLYQELGKTETISPALVQFQIDVEKYIRTESKWYGEDLFNYAYAVQGTKPMALEQAGVMHLGGMTLSLKTPMNVAYDPSGVAISSDGKNLPLFALGQILDYADTRALAGKSVQLDLSAWCTECAFHVIQMQWTGAPDKYTEGIVTDIVNDTLKTEENWKITDSAFISANIKDEQHVSHVFVVPNTSVNVAYVVVPIERQSPCHFKLTSMTLSASPAFGAIAVTEVTDTNLHPLILLGGMSQFAVNLVANQISLRYSVGREETNLPSGKEVVGTAPVKETITENDSNAYHGHLTFSSDGEAQIRTVMRCYSEKGGSVTNFWYKDVDGEIPDTRAPTLTIAAGDKSVHILSWECSIQVEDGEEIQLTGQSDVSDCFIFTKQKTVPLIQTTVTMKGVI